MSESEKQDCEREGQPSDSLCAVRSTQLLASDHEALIRKFCAYRDALDYCLAVLKSHHMTRAGISALVRKTEMIKANPEVREPRTDQPQRTAQ